MQSSSKKNSFCLQILLAISFALSVASAQTAFAQPFEEDGGPLQGQGPNQGPGQLQGQTQENMRGGQRWRQKMMNIPPEKREMFMQRMRERRGQEFQPGMRQPGMQGQPGMQEQPGQFGQGPEAMDGPGPGQRPGQRQPFMQGQRQTMRKRIGAGGQGFGFGGKALDLTQLNLSEKQKNDILALRAKHSEQAKSIQKNLRQRRMEMRNMLFSPDLNRKTLQDKKNELRGLQNQMDDIMIDDFLGIRSVLSEEQIKKLQETNLPNQKRKSAEVQPKNITD